MNKMNPEIKAQWIAALRSGEYNQGTDYLRQVLPSGRVTHCCLGVLCELAEKAGVVRKKDLDGVTKFVSVHSSMPVGWSSVAPLPRGVMDWSGLDSCMGMFTVGQVVSNLSVMNDTGSTFEEIAKIIEKEF